MDIKLVVYSTFGAEHFYLTTVRHTQNSKKHVRKFTIADAKTKCKQYHYSFTESMLIHAAAFVYRRYYK